MPEVPASRTFRIEVADRHGAVAMLIEPPAMSAGQRARADELAGRAIEELAALADVTDREALGILLAEVVRQYADLRAYERVTAQKGLLPL